MTDDELTARLAGLRIAVAFALKATCRHPAEVRSCVAALREMAGLIPTSAHPGVRDELEAIVAAMGRLPVKDPTVNPPVPQPAPPQLTIRQPDHGAPSPTAGGDGPLDELL